MLTPERARLMEYCIKYLSNKQCKEAFKILWLHFEGDAPNYQKPATKTKSSANTMDEQYTGRSYLD